MNMNEMATAVRQKLPLIEVVVNNRVLGMVRQWQTLFYDQHYSATVLDDGVDFVKLAESYGACGIRVTKEEEIAPAFEKAKMQDVPVLFEFMVAAEEIVLPMVKGGNPMTEMILK